MDRIELAASRALKLDVGVGDGRHVAACCHLLLVNGCEKGAGETSVTSVTHCNTAEPNTMDGKKSLKQERRLLLLLLPLLLHGG